MRRFSWTKLNAMLAEREWTQGELARRLGLTYVSAVQGWRSGRQPTLEMFLKLLEVLECDVDDLVDEFPDEDSASEEAEPTARGAASSRSTRRGKKAAG